MLSKTLDEWYKEAEHYASVYYEQYVRSYDDRNCTDEQRHQYCKIAKNYWSLKDALYHIKHYGEIHTPLKCAACRHNDKNHSQELQHTYKKYKKWIDIVKNN